MQYLTKLVIGVVAAAVIGCSDGNGGRPHANEKMAPTDVAVFKPELLQPLVLTAKPENILSVPEARSKADGEKVIVSGVSPPENVKPFNLALATFVLLSPDDAAKPEVIEEFKCDDAAICPRCRQILDKFAIRIELVDAHGQVLPTTVQGFSGIQPGRSITVEGTIKREGKDKKLIRVVATKFFPG
jgi:hypothetical protein